MDYLQYYIGEKGQNFLSCFKPCYKWITFNTIVDANLRLAESQIVLNLVINGLPSIRITRRFEKGMESIKF